MARKLVVEIVGDDTSLLRSLRRSSAGARTFDRDIGRATRGALAGSGVFRGLGRSIAFASGGFLAFASAGQFLRTSIDAAKEAQVTQAQLAAQFRASGKDIKDYQGAIEATTNRLSLLAGFENDELKAAFTTIFRATGNVSKSLRDTGLAADIARAKHIDLSKAATLVAKVEAGNTGLLRRQGVQLAKNVTVEQALTIARLKFLGQAKAGTTEQERFGAVLHNTEEIIGIGLLPTLNKFLAATSIWLTKMNESGKLQRDVAKAAHGVEEAFSALTDIFRGLNKVTGSTGNSLKTLGVAFVVLEARAKLLKWGLISTGIRGVGTSAAVASGEVGVLSGRLAGLRAIGPIAIPVTLLLGTKQGREIAKGDTDALKKVLSDSLDKQGLKDFGKLLIGGSVSPDSPIGRLLGLTKGTLGPSPDFRGAPQFPLKPFKPRVVFEGGQPPAAAPKQPTSLQGRFNLAALKLAQAGLTPSTADDRLVLSTQAAITRLQIAQTKTLKDRTALTQQLAGIVEQIRSIDSADAATQKKATDQVKKRHVVDLAALRQTRQFRALGLGPTGDALVPNRKALQKELGKVSDVVSGTFLDTSKTQSVLSKIRRVLGGGLGKLSQDVRSTVKRMLDDLNQQFRDQAGSASPTLHKASSAAFVRILGLTDAAQIRQARAVFSQIGVGGTVPSSSRLAPSQSLDLGGRGGDIVVHAHTYIDGKEIAPTVTRHQQKAARRNPGQRSGPHAGQ